LYALDHSRDHVRKNIGHCERALVEPKYELVTVPLQMPSAHLLIDTAIAAFEQGPELLDALGMQFDFCVIDRLVDVV